MFLNNLSFNKFYYTRSSHDSSFCFLKNQKLNYFKHERFLQMKHFGLEDKGSEYIIEQENKIIRTLNPEVVILPERLLEDDIFHNAVKHHHLHALSVDFMEKTPCDVHIVIDGNGNSRWYSVYRNDQWIDSGFIKNTNGSLGLGLIWSGFLCGVTAKHGMDIPGKVMGLQSYGKLNELHYEKIEKYNMNYIGDQDAFDTEGPLERIPRPFLKNENHLFAVPEDISSKEKLDILHTIHKKAGEIVLSIFEKYAKPNEHIGYSGGVAQNIIWNTMIKNRYPNLSIYPHCGDEGLVIGFAEHYRKIKNISKENFSLKNYPYSQFDQAPNEDPSIDTIHKTAKYLAEGKIVAWYQGHGEIGPRALGNRSILMDPRIPNGKNIINNVKKREIYRPFGCSVLEEYAKEYFDLNYPNPYMLYLGYTQKKELRSITHVDGTSRCQTVNSSCGYFRTLLEHFFELTRCPVLLNTSLNEAGKPIAGWIHNAENLFKSSSIDVLVVGNKIYRK